MLSPCRASKARFAANSGQALWLLTPSVARSPANQYRAWRALCSVEYVLQPTWSPGSLAGELAVAERIAARDLNNLYQTSCFFHERERYAAFCSLYAVMRVIDDRIDGLPFAQRSSPAVVATERGIVDAWERVLAALTVDPGAQADLAAWGHADAALLLRHAADATRVLGVPMSIWSDFFAAMRRDIATPELFATFADLLAYTQGASVAPTTVYLYILAADFAPGAARPDRARRDHLAALGQALGRFAYLGHVVRDLPQDAVASERGLWYVSRADLDAFGLDEGRIRADVDVGQSSPGLTRLVAELVARAWTFNREGRALLAKHPLPLRADCAFVLELIIRIYERVLDKVAGCGFDVLQRRHQLSRDERAALAIDVARDVGLPLR